MRVKCSHCGIYGEKETMERVDGKYLHSACAVEAKDKKALADYITKIFGLKAPGPRNYALIKKYHDELGFSYKGMMSTLRYFFEIKQNSIAKSNESIGIIPYVYEEAKNYYNNLVIKSTNLSDTIDNQNQIIHKKINLRGPARKRPQLIEMVELEESDE